jgi:hypothetical protein
VDTQVVEANYVDLVHDGVPGQVPAIVDQKVITAPAAAYPPALPAVYPAKIAKALIAVTREVGAIGKLGENKHHSYFYQRWEDVLARMSVLLPQHGLIVLQTETGRSLFDNDTLLALTYQFTIINEDGDVWPLHARWTAISRLKDQKGVYDDKSANKCHTQAHKGRSRRQATTLGQGRLNAAASGH